MTWLLIAAGIVGAVLCLLVVSSLVTGRFTPWSRKSECFRDHPVSFVLQQTILILVVLAIFSGIVTIA
jgi:NADH:ubiquinone oxidoreductase subunit 5 (subunit L)/multisubunit Na+/H+ antiporter MnhA subunit